MELVPDNVNEKELQEEINRRTCKAGHITKYGEPTSSGRILSKPLSRKGRKNYRRIFGHN